MKLLTIIFSLLFNIINSNMSIQKLFPLATKFYHGCAGIKFIKRSYSKVFVETLSNLAGISYVEARRYVVKYKIPDDIYLLEKHVKFCQKLGYSLPRVVKISKFLNRHPTKLQQHYLTMEESGFVPISPEVLANFDMIMRKPVACLKDKKLIQQDINIVEKIVSYIENEEIRSRMPLDYREEDSWTDVHLNIVRAFLRMRLDVTEDQLETMFSIHRTVKNKSLRVIQENIKIAEDLGFNHAKLLRCGYVLANFPEYTKSTLREYPTLLGNDMRKAMFTHAKLMMTTPRKIEKIYKILKDYGIPDGVIARRLNIFCLSCKTVENRLKEIRRMPDLKLYSDHPCVIGLVLRFNTIRARLNFLNEMPIRCRAPYLLTAGSDTIFEANLTEGKDANRLSDLLGLLRSFFSCDLEQIHNQLKKHPKYMQVPLEEIKATYTLLRDRNYSNSSIIKVIWIILYPMENMISKVYVIQPPSILELVNRMRNISNKINPQTLHYVRNEYVNKLHFCRDKVEKVLFMLLSDQYRFLGEVTKLNLILYFLEKDHHFTGNGIWPHDYISDVVEKTCK